MARSRTSVFTWISLSLTATGLSAASLPAALLWAVGTSLLVPEADGVSGRPCVVFIEALAAGSSG